MSVPLIICCPPPLKFPLYPSSLVENIVKIRLGFSRVVWLFESHNTHWGIPFGVFHWVFMADNEC